MLVKTGDKLTREGLSYEVLIADDNIFVIGLASYNEQENAVTVSYEYPEIYANQKEINTLEDLHFVKVDKFSFAK